MSDWLSYREAATIMAQRMSTSEFNATQLLNDAVRHGAVHAEALIPGLPPSLFDMHSLNLYIENLQRKTAPAESPITGAGSVAITTAARKKGQKPVQLNRVLAEMRAFGVQALETWTQEAMRAQFGASRETCMKALKLLKAEEAAA